jgi:hypothetical protein
LATKFNLAKRVRKTSNIPEPTELPPVAEYVNEVAVTIPGSATQLLSAAQDSGAGRSFMSLQTACHLGLPIGPSRFDVELADGSTIGSAGSVVVEITMVTRTIVYAFELIDNPSYQMIFGRDLLNYFHLNPPPLIPNRVGSVCSSCGHHARKVDTPACCTPEDSSELDELIFADLTEEQTQQRLHLISTVIDPLITDNETRFKEDSYCTAPNSVIRAEHKAGVPPIVEEELPAEGP